VKKAVLTLALFLVAANASAKNLYIPVAGVAPGINNTLFRTDVRLFNPSFTRPIGISIHFLPQGWDGSNISGRVVNLAPRQMVTLNNIVENFLQWPVPAVGAIRLDSDTDKSYSFIAESRTYTDSPNPAAPGTYGQFVPALDPADGLNDSVALHVTHSSDYTQGFRANAGIMNPNRVFTVVTPSLYRADGTLIAEGASIQVEPMSMIQRSIPAMFGEGVSVEDGYIEFSSSYKVFTWVSIIDNRSSDGVFVLGADDKATEEPLPGPGN
jgi:hypothetical protein